MSFAWGISWLSLKLLLPFKTLPNYPTAAVVLEVTRTCSSQNHPREMNFAWVISWFSLQLLVPAPLGTIPAKWTLPESYPDSVCSYSYLLLSEPSPRNELCLSHILIQFAVRPTRTCSSRNHPREMSFAWVSLKLLILVPLSFAWVTSWFSSNLLVLAHLSLITIQQQLLCRHRLCVKLPHQLNSSSIVLLRFDLR